MKISSWIGVILFLIGIIILAISGLMPLYSEIKSDEILLTVKIGVALLIIGAIIIILQLSLERYKEMKKIKEEIPEEDLRP
ncbi:hypothetical protein B6U71_02390 [Euryarchaeota archaeon ex4484_178]|nr:MAG: hypothetical protein B6U71_02390 [Euryarchaeota archaeon ex4484_178]